MADEKLAARFWNKAVEVNGCWIWGASKFKSGYGLIVVDGKHKRAHRIAYELTNGPFDQSLEVCHTCDEPACIRPDHLFLGTHADNMADAKSKGRLTNEAAVNATRGRPKLMMQGDKHPNSKLTPSAVLEMRRRRRLGHTYKAISDDFGIPLPTAEAAINGRTWKYLESANG